MKYLILLALILESVLAGSLPGNYGYATANETYGVDYFYWYFDPVIKASDSTPLVMWLTGGPGCSSELALFFENGPYKVNEDASGVIPNKYGWNRKNYLLYVDQPGGTGFSTVKNPDGYVTNEEEVAIDMHNFLTNFFKKHSDLATLPFYIFGESYAGHYVPAISAYLVENAPEINFQGMAIGNGFIDPGIQTASFGPFVYGHNLMSASQLQQTQAGVEPCQTDIKNGDWKSAFNSCGAVLDDALQFCAQNKGSQCNVYNIGAPCNGPLCYNFTNVGDFLNNPDIQKQLGVDNIPWKPCDSEPYSYLINDFDRSYRGNIPKVLAKNFPVIIYDGNQDIICNFYGETALLDTMPWPGQSDFNNAKNQTWTVGGQTAGNYRSAQGLTYVVVFDAGHMVPHDQPAAALDLMEKVITNQWK